MMISVIIPVFNELQNLNELITRLTQSINKIGLTDSSEILFIDDNSTDGTYEYLSERSQKNNQIKVLGFTRNFGHQTALYAGLEHCKGDFAVIMDGDLQDPPELIEQLYSHYKSGYKVVNAKRTKRKGETFLKKTTAVIFYRFLKKTTSFDIPVDTGDFRLIDRSVIEHLKNMSEQNKYIRGQIAWLGLKTTEVEYVREERKYGKTSFSYSKMFRFAMDGITSFSDVPIRLVTFLGLFFFGVSALIIFYALYSYFYLERYITGWTSLIISTMFIGGIQLLCIGIIGQYISRMDKNLRKRPFYVLKNND